MLAAAPAAPHSSSSCSWTQQSTPYLLLVDDRTPPTITRTLLIRCSYVARTLLPAAKPSKLTPRRGPEPTVPGQATAQQAAGGGDDSDGN